MGFVHRPLNLPEINATTGETGRVYHTPQGNFPSVTTVLQSALDHTALDAWRKRVGEDEAKSVSTQASNRGTAVHNLAEKYLLNDPFWKKGAMPVNVDSFNSIRPILDRNIGIIYGLEIPLYSQRLHTAGRTDVVAQFNGIDSIVDFKTSRRIKTEKDVLGYFIQETCYSVMLEEMTGLECSQLVTVMAVDHEDPIVFIKHRDEYKSTMEKIFINYAKANRTI
jgi:hypothetical protein